MEQQEVLPEALPLFLHLWWFVQNVATASGGITFGIDMHQPSYSIIIFMKCYFCDINIHNPSFYSWQQVLLGAGSRNPGLPPAHETLKL